MEPQIIEDLDVLKYAGLRIVHGCRLTGTCVSKGNASLVDYFAMSTELTDVIDQSNIIDLKPKPHRPFQVAMKCRPRNIQVQVLKQPAPLSADPPFGPLIALPPWENANEMEETLNRLGLLEDSTHYPTLTQADRDLEPQALDQVFDDWMKRAEQDLLAVFDKEPTESHRGRSNMVVSVNVVNTFRCKRAGSSLACGP